MVSTTRAEQDAKRVEEQDVERYYSMNEDDKPRRVTPPSDDYYFGLVSIQGTHQEQHAKMEGLVFQRKVWRMLSCLLFLIFSISIVIGRCLDPSPQRRQRLGVERPPMVTLLWIASIVSLISFFVVFSQFFVVQRQLDDFRGQLVLRNYDADFVPPTAVLA